MDKIEVKDMDIVIDLNKDIHTFLSSNNLDLRMLLNKLNNKVNNKDVYIDDKNIKDIDINYIKNNLVVVFNDEEYNNQTVIEEIGCFLHYLGYDILEIESRIDDLKEYFDIDKIISEKIERLTVKRRVLVKILSYLIIRPSVLAIDNLFMYLSKEDVVNILDYAKKYQINILYMTTDSEFILKSDYNYIINEGKCILSGRKEEILGGNSILPFLGIKLPFLVELSNNLVLYELIDKSYFDKESLVDELWK